MRPNPTDPEAVRRWLAPLLTRAVQLGKVPSLGSRAWRELPDRDPRKYAALARTALAWLDENTEEAIGARLRQELDDFASAVRRMFAEAARDGSLAAAELRYGTGPTHAELVRRRNTHTCHWCATTFYGPVACPNGCGTPEQIRARAAASWARVEPERHRRVA